jgi:hypothetical protein
VFALSWALAVLLLLGFGLKLLRELGVNPAQAPSFLSLPGMRKSGEQEAKLYFSNEDATRLVPEKRQILLGAGTAADATAIMSELLAGPHSATLLRTIPPDTRLLNAYKIDSTLVLDFTHELQANHPKGSTAELMTVYSIVNTMAENFLDIVTVQILVEGEEIETLAGHVDMAKPLLPEKKWMTGWPRDMTGGPSLYSSQRTAVTMRFHPNSRSSQQCNRCEKAKSPV